MANDNELIFKIGIVSDTAGIKTVEAEIKRLKDLVKSMSVGSVRAAGGSKEAETVMLEARRRVESLWKKLDAGLAKTLEIPLGSEDRYKPLNKALENHMKSLGTIGGTAQFESVVANLKQAGSGAGKLSEAIVNSLVLPMSQVSIALKSAFTKIAKDLASVKSSVPPLISAAEESNNAKARSTGKQQEVVDKEAAYKINDRFKSDQAEKIQKEEDQVFKEDKRRKRRISEHEERVANERLRIEQEANQAWKQYATIIEQQAARMRAGGGAETTPYSFKKYDASDVLRKRTERALKTKDPEFVSASFIDKANDERIAKSKADEVKRQERIAKLTVTQEKLQQEYNEIIQAAIRARQIDLKSSGAAMRKLSQRAAQSGFTPDEESGMIRKIGQGEQAWHTTNKVPGGIIIPPKLPKTIKPDDIIHSTVLSRLDDATKKISFFQGRILTLHNVFAASLATGMIAAFFRPIIEFNSTMESSKIGIAAILTGTNNIISADGKKLEGREKFNAAMEISGDIQKKLQGLAFKTATTYEILLKTYQGILGPAAAAGIRAEESIKLTGLLVTATKTMHLADNQILQESKDLIEGGIKPASSTVATALGINDTMLKGWKAKGINKETGEAVVYEELTKKLYAFSLAQKATIESFLGLWSNVKDAFMRSMGVGLEPVFAVMKKKLDDLVKTMFVEGKGGVMDIKPEIIAKLREFGDKMAYVGDKLYYLGTKIVPIFVSFIEQLTNLFDMALKVGGVLGKVFPTGFIDDWGKLLANLWAVSKVLGVLNAASIILAGGSAMTILGGAGAAATGAGAAGTLVGLETTALAGTAAASTGVATAGAGGIIAALGGVTVIASVVLAVAAALGVSKLFKWQGGQQEKVGNEYVDSKFMEGNLQAIARLLSTKEEIAARKAENDARNIAQYGSSKEDEVVEARMKAWQEYEGFFESLKAGLNIFDENASEKLKTAKEEQFRSEFRAGEAGTEEEKAKAKQEMEAYLGTMGVSASELANGFLNSFQQYLAKILAGMSGAQIIEFREKNFGGKTPTIGGAPIGGGFSYGGIPLIGGGSSVDWMKPSKALIDASREVNKPKRLPTATPIGGAAKPERARGGSGDGNAAALEVAKTAYRLAEGLAHLSNAATSLTASWVRAGDKTVYAAELFARKMGEIELRSTIASAEAKIAEARSKVEGVNKSKKEITRDTREYNQEHGTKYTNAKRIKVETAELQSRTVEIEERAKISKATTAQEERNAAAKLASEQAARQARENALKLWKDLIDAANIPYGEGYVLDKAERLKNRDDRKDPTNPTGKYEALSRLADERSTMKEALDAQKEMDSITKAKEVIDKSTINPALQQIKILEGLKAQAEEASSAAAADADNVRAEKAKLESVELTNQIKLLKEKIQYANLSIIRTGKLEGETPTAAKQYAVKEGRKWLDDAAIKSAIASEASAREARLKVIKAETTAEIDLLNVKIEIARVSGDWKEIAALEEDVAKQNLITARAELSMLKEKGDALAGLIEKQKELDKFVGSMSPKEKKAYDDNLASIKAYKATISTGVKVMAEAKVSKEERNVARAESAKGYGSSLIMSMQDKVAAMNQKNVWKAFGEGLSDQVTSALDSSFADMIDNTPKIKAEINQLEDYRVALTDAYHAGKIGAEEYNKQILQLDQDNKKLKESIKSVWDYMLDFLKSISKELISLINKKLASQLFEGLIGTDSKSGGTNGGIIGWVTKVVSAAVSSTPKGIVPPSFDPNALDNVSDTKSTGAPPKNKNAPLSVRSLTVAKPNLGKMGIGAIPLSTKTQSVNPNVSVNVVNQSSQPLTTSSPQVSFDGARMVVDIVVSDLKSFGPIAQTLKGA